MNERFIIFIIVNIDKGRIDCVTKQPLLSVTDNNVFE